MTKSRGIRPWFYGVHSSPSGWESAGTQLLDVRGALDGAAASVRAGVRRAGRSYPDPVDNGIQSFKKENREEAPAKETERCGRRAAQQPLQILVCRASLASASASSLGCRVQSS
jgi:hypothetical protein